MNLPLAVAFLVLSSFSDRFEEIKKSASPEELYAFLYDLPKGGDLHNHLGGSGLAETWWRIATDKDRNGGQDFYTRVRLQDCAEDCPSPLVRYHTVSEAAWRKLPSCCRDQYRVLSQLSAEEREGWMSSVRLDKAGEGREEFFGVIWTRLDALLDDAVVTAEMMVENMKLFAAERVRYIEFQFSPFGRKQGDGAALDGDQLSQTLRDRLRAPDARATGVTVRFLASVLRFRPDAEAEVERAYDFLDRQRDLWVGINLVGREDDDRGHPRRFLEVFQRMRRRYSGIGVSIHGGEIDEPGRRVRDTLLLGATRIGHAVNLISDPETLLFLRQGPYLIETSLVSNHLLQYTPDVSRHPFPEYLRLGVPVCLNTDDRGMWDSNLTDEYFAAITHFNLTWEELVGLGRNSLEHSFTDSATKARLLEEYAADISVFVEKYSRGDWKPELAAVKPHLSGYARRSFEVGSATPR